MIVQNGLPEQQAQEETVTLALNSRQFNVIVAGLGELPHKISNDVLQNIVAQVQKQIKTGPGV
jgi:hypothetical protein